MKVITLNSTLVYKNKLMYWEFPSKLCADLFVMNNSRFNWVYNCREWSPQIYADAYIVPYSPNRRI